MKRCRRDDKPVAIWSFAELGATFQVTVSLLYDQELFDCYCQEFLKQTHYYG